MIDQASARYMELLQYVNGTHPSIDRSSHVLQHPDGTIAKITPSGITWISPEGEEVNDVLLWPPRTYAAHLCRAPMPPRIRSGTARQSQGTGGFGLSLGTSADVSSSGAIPAGKLQLRASLLSFSNNYKFATCNLQCLAHFYVAIFLNFCNIDDNIGRKDSVV